MSGEGWTVVIVIGAVVAIATLVGAIVLAVKVLRTRKLLGELGMRGKVAFYGALTYTILPVDLIPDPIYLDDMGVLAGSLIYLTRLVQRRQAARAGALTGHAPQHTSLPPGNQRGARRV